MTATEALRKASELIAARAEAASLREREADLRNELSYWRTNLAAAEAERDELRGLVERAVAELAGVEAFSLERLIPHNSVTRLLHDLLTAPPLPSPSRRRLTVNKCRQ